MNPRELAYIVGDFDPIDEDKLRVYEIYLFWQRPNPARLKMEQVQGRELAMKRLLELVHIRWPKTTIEHDDTQVWPANCLYLLGMIAPVGSLQER